jgi:hypothetical protein
VLDYGVIGWELRLSPFGVVHMWTLLSDMRNWLENVWETGPAVLLVGPWVWKAPPDLDTWAPAHREPWIHFCMRQGLKKAIIAVLMAVILLLLLLFLPFLTYFPYDHGIGEYAKHLAKHMLRVARKRALHVGPAELS